MFEFMRGKVWIWLGLMGKVVFSILIVYHYMRRYILLLLIILLMHYRWFAR